MKNKIFVSHNVTKSKQILFLNFHFVKIWNNHSKIDNWRWFHHWKKISWTILIQHVFIHKKKIDWYSFAKFFIIYRVCHKFVCFVRFSFRLIRTWKCSFDVQFELYVNNHKCNSKTSYMKYEYELFIYNLYYSKCYNKTLCCLMFRRFLNFNT